MEELYMGFSKEKIDEKIMMERYHRVNNWGKWGPDDEIGTLNYVTPENVLKGAECIRSGKVFSLGMNFDTSGPQTGRQGRNNPVRAMIWTGSDAVEGRQELHNPQPEDRQGDKWYPCLFADDIITMPLQCATHWDALGHIFQRNLETGEIFMYGGRSPKNVDCTGGCTYCGIEKYDNHMAGRGVLLDMARYRGQAYMEPGDGITCDDLENCAKKQRVEIRKGDFLLIRTGDSDRRIREKNWGTYCGSDAPGLEQETIVWLHDKEVAAVAMDTWGCEVKPNRSDMFDQPWHGLCITMCGLPMGENLRLDALADDCAADGRYDFMFVAAPLLITGGTASPINPYAIR